MLEKEIKVFNLGTAEEIEKILIEKGAKLVKFEEQQNIIYNFKNKMIRLRKRFPLNEERKYRKPPILEYTIKTNTEITETHRIDSERTINISLDVFEKLLSNYKKEKSIYIPVLVGNKLRKSFKLNNFLYEIDVWNRFICPYTYLEIEALEPQDELIDGIKQILTEEQINSIITTTLGIGQIYKYYHNANNFFDLFTKCNVFKDDMLCIDRFIKIIDKELNIKGLVQTGVVIS